VLNECTARGIAFVPFCPLDWPKRYVMRSAPIRSSLGIAAHHDATPAQVTLAWLLAIADNVPLIPGTSSRSHLAENLAAVSVSLQDDEVASLRAAFAEPRRWSNATHIDFDGPPRRCTCQTKLSSLPEADVNSAGAGHRTSARPTSD
jgi:diketogulonate reductase-like aldo/keto reductase